MPHHGMAHLRGSAYACSHANPTQGRFRRLFPDLPPLYHKPGILEKAGAHSGPMNEQNAPNLGTSSTIPLGYCFLGQFIDHDITLDISSSIDRVNDPDEIQNVRTPALDLDCVYGQGTDASRHQYQHVTSTDFYDSIRSGHIFATESDRDLSRSKVNEGAAALIGDFRNDENRIVSQLQLIFLRFHNTVSKHLLDDLNGTYAPLHGFSKNLKSIHNDRGDVGTARALLFEETQRLVRWHYQWVVVNDFLPRICGKDIVTDILCNGRKVFTCKSDPFIPVEFSIAAYRYGHTQVPEKMMYNNSIQSTPLFSGDIGDGFERVATGSDPIDWRNFFGSTAQSAGAIDTKLASAMLDLPFMPNGAEKSLATRNLLRAQSFRLPSGQHVAQALTDLGCGPIAPLDLSPTKLPPELHDHTPLWLYVMAEGLLSNGEHLGPVGGRIIAEVIIGLLECDHSSYLGANRNWSPTLLKEKHHTFDMAGLIGYAENLDIA